MKCERGHHPKKNPPRNELHTETSVYPIISYSLDRSDIYWKLAWNSTLSFYVGGLFVWLFVYLYDFTNEDNNRKMKPTTTTTTVRNVRWWVVVPIEVLSFKPKQKPFQWNMFKIQIKMESLGWPFRWTVWSDDANWIWISFINLNTKSEWEFI